MKPRFFFNVLLLTLIVCLTSSCAHQRTSTRKVALTRKISLNDTNYGAYNFASYPNFYYRMDYQWYLNNNGRDSHLYTLPDDTLIGTDPGGTYDIGLDSVITNTSVKVGVIDTGVRMSAEEFNGITFDGWNFMEENTDLSDFAYDSHGTIIVGELVANGPRIHGILQMTNLTICKVSFANRDWGDAQINRAIAYCADNGCKIVNLAWSTPNEGIDLSNACVYAASKGMIIVCAVENIDMDTDVTPDYPESWHFDNVVAVTSATRLGQKYSPAAWGKTTIHLAAPGRVIASVGNTSNYVYSSGTSMASPMVTAALTALAVKYPNQPYQYWIEKLVKSCTPEPTLSETISGGLLNIRAALIDEHPTLTLSSAGLSVSGYSSAIYMLQSSTNLLDWTTLMPVTNGGVYNISMTNNCEFFRTILK